ncbi:MAG: hypothetical protein AAGG51_22995 [Cyanobacteria bacterium P01_G01_bin.54]
MPDIYGGKEARSKVVNPVLQTVVADEPVVIVPANAGRLSCVVAMATQGEFLLLSYGDTILTVNTFSVLLQFGQSYFDDLFLGQIRALSWSGNPIVVNVVEFKR